MEVHVFVVGTKVITDKGYKNIEDVKVGDKVLTHKNRYKTVLKIGHNDDKQTYFVKSQGMFKTETTENHPYYVREMKWVWNNEMRRNEKKWEEPKFKQVKDINKNDFVGINIPIIEENPLNLDSELCYLLGRYVADGHIRHSKRAKRKNSFQYGVVYSIGDNKIKDFKSKISNRHLSIYKHSKGCYRAVLNSKEIVELIEKLNFGKGAINKRIPSEILNLPISLAKNFLDGYMSGDGCFTQNRFQASSISKQLIMQLQLLIAKIYKTSSNVNLCIRPKKHTIEGRIVNQNTVYSITFSKKNKQAE